MLTNVYRTCRVGELYLQVLCDWMCCTMGDHQNGVCLADHTMSNFYQPSLPVVHSCSHGSHSKSGVIGVVQFPVRGQKAHRCIHSSTLYWRTGQYSTSVLTCILPPFYGHSQQLLQSTAGTPVPHWIHSTLSTGRCECRPTLALPSQCTVCRVLPPEASWQNNNNKKSFCEKQVRK